MSENKRFATCQGDYQNVGAPPNDPVEPSHAVLLIPGLCGTILHVKDKTVEDEGERVWVCIEYADEQYQKLWGKFDPDTGLIVQLQANLEVVIPKGPVEDGGLYCLDLLDPDAYLPLHVADYYHGLITSLKADGYTPGKDLFGFGYDFRQSNRVHVAGLLEKLKAVSAANGGRPVDVVTHSMGGLLLQTLLVQHPNEFQALVHKWVAIACPFKGAPGFVTDALLTGVQFAGSWGKYFFVGRSTVHQMVAQSPAVFELLPPPEFDWGDLQPPTVSVYYKADGVTRLEVYGLADFYSLLDKAMAGNQVLVGGQPVALPLNPGIVAFTDESKRMWSSAKLPSSCQFFSIHGTGVQTAFSVSYGSTWFPVTDYKQVRDMLGSFSVVEGDGTVPAASALADGFEAVERVGLPGYHRALLDLAETWSHVKKWLANEEAPDGDWVLVEKPYLKPLD